MAADGRGGARRDEQPRRRGDASGVSGEVLLEMPSFCGGCDESGLAVVGLCGWI